MTIIEQLNEGIKDAMRSKAQLRMDTLRMLKSKILAVDARGNLPDSDVQKLFKTYCGNLQDALEQSVELNRPEATEKLRSEIVIVQEFLPKQLSQEETRAIVIQAVQESGATSRKEFGIVMKAIMKLNSSVDGKLAKEIANELLSD